MSDVMAIVAKAVFEKAAGKTPALGKVLGLDRYVSANRGLTPLTGGGRLFLVTVRPPDEALWLVAVLDNPSFSGSEWVAAASPVPLTDLSALKSQLKFENGKGLPTAAGTLGMSLQTPRVLVPGDVALLEKALGGALPAGAAPAAASSSSGAADAGKAKAAAAPADPAAPLWAAVLAAPLDEAPRLALAAHWRATGEPRGELAEIDLALRAPLSRHRRLQLRPRRDALIEAHGARWWPWPLEKRRQRGGFLTAITADLSEGVKHVAAAVTAEPISELELLSADEDSLAQLAKAAWLSRIRVLAVRGGIGDDGLAALLKSKHLTNLEALNLSSNELSGEGLAALGKQLPALRRLVLTANAIGDEGAEALAQWQQLGQLRTLYLTACELSVDGLDALLRSGQLTSLEKWTLGQNELGDKAGELISTHAAQLHRLQFLELIDIGLRNAGTKALAAQKLPALRYLDLSGNSGSYKELMATYGDAVVRG